MEASVSPAFIKNNNNLTKQKSMKKFVLVVLAGTMLSVCHAQNSGYQISGTVEDMQSGLIYLRCLGDTIARAEIKGGKFAFQGKVDEPKVADFVIEGKMNRGISFFLENTNIEAKLNSALPEESDIQGGAEQKAYQEYMDMQQMIQERRTQLFQQLSSAKTQEEADSIQNVFNSLMGKDQEAEADFIRTHADAGVSAFLVYQSMQPYTLEYAKGRYGMLSEKGKATYYGRQAAEKIALRERTDRGMQAPDFTVNGTADQPFNLYDVKGTYKIVFFHTLDLSVIEKHFNVLKELYDLYHDKGLEVVSVCGDRDVEAWKKLMGEKRYPWRVGIVTDESVAKLYGLEKRFSNIYVLDENNKIVQKGVSGTALKMYVERYYK